MLGILGTCAVGLDNPFDADKPGKPLIDVEEDEIIVGIDDLEENLEDQPYVTSVECIVQDTDVLEDKLNTEKDVEVPVTQTWARWNPQALKSKRSAELMTPLSTKKSKTTVGESVKKYTAAKVDYLNMQKTYFENEEKRAQEKHEAEEGRARERHEWERAHHELKMIKLRLEIQDLKKQNE